MASRLLSLKWIVKSFECKYTLCSWCYVIQVWTAALCMMDSDGDGMLNGVELGDPNCGWINGDASPGPVLGHPGKI